jgi:hypothetical protein
MTSYGLVLTFACAAEPDLGALAGAPGLLTVQRWVGRDDPRLRLVLHEFDGASSARSAGLLAERTSPSSRPLAEGEAGHEVYAGEQFNPGDVASPEGAAGFYVVGMNAPTGAEEEFNRWYDEEHLPRLAAVPGVLAARRYRTWSGPRTYLAIYHVEDPRIPGSEAWLAAAETPWTHAMRARVSDRRRLVFVPRKLEAETE